MKWFLTLAASLLSATLAAHTISHMDRLTPEQKAAAHHLKLTGKLSVEGNSDFRQMRDLCWQLQTADLSAADCEVIPANAFHSRRQLEQVMLPGNVRTIGSQAFFACRSLRTLNLPKSLERVGDAAFSCCEELQEVVIEGSPVLGEFAFARLKGLRTMRVLSAEPPVATPSTFEGIDHKQVKLIVPKGAELKYRKATGWNSFFSAGRAASAICQPQKVLLPLPASLQLLEGKPLHVLTNWTVTASTELANECEQAKRILNELIPATSIRKLAGKTTLCLSLDSTLQGGHEAYTLQVNANDVQIKGATATGVFYGLMTLEQLLRGDATASCCEALPQMYIADAPRTALRELMLDPCRIFIPFDELKAFVPEMARYKLNALHLHLVDDQAWRLEIKKYPQLIERSSARMGMDDMLMPISGYYTQAQMRELVEYAARYHVQVIPEIEMPGHEVAAIHAYPELTCGAKQVPLRTVCGVSNELLCPGKESTFEFLNNVFDEVAATFSSPYIHLGGDEAGNPPLDCWTNCTDCQQLKRKLGITSTDRSENWRLQQYLFDRVINTLRTKHGKTPMFWYETDFKKVPEGCVIFAWRNGLTQEALDAAAANRSQVMLCPGEHCYFDYPMAQGDMPEVNWGMPVTSLRQTYDLDPAWNMGAAFEQNYVLGVAGTLWSECINSTERIYYQAYPRAMALAEVGWSKQQNRSWNDFVVRLTPTLRYCMRRGIPFSMKY